MISCSNTALVLFSIGGERVERRVRGETEGEKEVDVASKWSRVRVVP